MSHEYNSRALIVYRTLTTLSSGLLDPVVGCWTKKNYGKNNGRKKIVSFFCEKKKFNV